MSNKKREGAKIAKGRKCQGSTKRHLKILRSSKTRKNINEQRNKMIEQERRQ
jgi:hypothetical protein